MDKENKAGYVKEVFNTIAGGYDKMNLIMTWGMLPRWQKKVLRLTDLKLGDMALDVCCGTGEMTYKAAKRVGPFGGAVGLDFSEEMLDRAREKFNVNTLSLKFIQGDALNLPFQDNLFTAATNGFALRNVSDIKKNLQEMARVVKSGGKVVCIEVSRPSFPINRAFFNLYYFRFVPWLGKVLGNDKKITDGYEPYTWLAESLKDFPSRKGIVALYEEAGMHDVKAYPVGFGAVTIYVGVVR